MTVAMMVSGFITWFGGCWRWTGTGPASSSESRNDSTASMTRVVVEIPQVDVDRSLISAESNAPARR
jgi:hypothetical protein